MKWCPTAPRDAYRSRRGRGEPGTGESSACERPRGTVGRTDRADPSPWLHRRRPPRPRCSSSVEPAGAVGRMSCPTASAGRPAEQQQPELQRGDPRAQDGDYRNVGGELQPLDVREPRRELVLVVPSVRQLLSDKPGHAGPVRPGHRNRASRRNRGSRDGAQNQRPPFAALLDCPRNAIVAASASRLLPSTSAWLRARDCNSAAALPGHVQSLGWGRAGRGPAAEGFGDSPSGWGRARAPQGGTPSCVTAPARRLNSMDIGAYATACSLTHSTAALTDYAAPGTTVVRAAE